MESVFFEGRKGVISINAIELLRVQFKSAHETLEGTMAETTPEVADFSDTKKALPVGAAYAHAVAGEDVVLTSMVMHTEPLLKEVETGMSEMMPSQEHWDQHDAWAHRVKVDLAKFRTYAEKVYAQTDAYLATLKEADLDQEVDMGAMGKQNLAFLLNNFLLLHIANLTGEISAAKGFQGQKGYPF